MATDFPFRELYRHFMDNHLEFLRNLSLFINEELDYHLYLINQKLMDNYHYIDIFLDILNHLFMKMIPLHLKIFKFLRQITLY